jgi:SAM-dependent methyltransferase
MTKEENNQILQSHTIDAQKIRYNDSYFAMYRDDPKRLVMYHDECARIKELKPHGGRILDVGCGIGGFLSFFDPSRWDRYGVDVSDLAIREARLKGIKVNDFLEAYDYPDYFFDVIVFRGSIQLLPTPFSIIETCIRLLKEGGYMIFLSTPNSNSPYYRRFKTLPFLTPHANFLIPSDIMMQNALQNFGLQVKDIRYPYIDGPYCKPIIDHFLFILSFIGFKRKFAFWRSSMEIYAVKPFKNLPHSSLEN